MAEKSIGNKYKERAVFQKGEQRAFLGNVKNRLNLRSVDLAELSGVHIRSVTDWKREKHHMSFDALKKLCQEANLPLPKNIEIRGPFWYTSKGSSKGGIAVYKKHGHIGGDPEYRKKKWYEWWEREGKFKEGSIIKGFSPIATPSKSSELAEFFGIILGDGGITPRQVTITLHKFDDRHFVDYVKNLLTRLFNVTPSVYERVGENTFTIVVSRGELVKFLVENGLKVGGKVRQQVGVPGWIEEADTFRRRCLRGLFDTDGCFYIDRHSYKDKIYLNCAMDFTNRSLPILNFFKTNLEKLDLHPTQKTEFSIALRREREIIRYFQEVGSSNRKHHDKFIKYFKDKYGEVPKWS